MHPWLFTVWHCQALHFLINIVISHCHIRNLVQGNIGYWNSRYFEHTYLLLLSYRFLDYHYNPYSSRVNPVYHSPNDWVSAWLVVWSLLVATYIFHCAKFICIQGSILRVIAGISNLNFFFQIPRDRCSMCFKSLP